MRPKYPVCAGLRITKERALEACADWRRGRRYGYPVCCVAHYCWDTLMGASPAAVRYLQIHYDHTTPGSRWTWSERPWDHSPHVPCGLLHSRGSQVQLRTRLARILAYNLRSLRQGVREGQAKAADHSIAASLLIPPPPQVSWMDDTSYQAWLTGVELTPELEWV